MLKAVCLTILWTLSLLNRMCETITSVVTLMLLYLNEKTNKQKNPSILYQDTKVWNSLSNTITEAYSTVQFERLYKEYYLK